MLREEYEKRRQLPRRLRQPSPAPAEFSYTIRPATTEDLPHTLALYRHWVRNSVVTFDEKPPTLRTYRSRFAHYTKHGFPFLVAESPHGDILGFASVQPFRQKSAFRKTVESSVYLGPASMGKRLGRALMVELIAACQAAGITEMIAVIADQGAEASVGLHKSLGFVETGRMEKVGYKFERWIGIILMQKSLR